MGKSEMFYTSNRSSEVEQGPAASDGGSSPPGCAT